MNQFNHESNTSSVACLPEQTGVEQGDLDVVLLERAKDGSKDAMGEIVRLHQDMWFRFCLSQLRDYEWARDATQETALRVMKGIEKYRGDSRFKTWAFGIALNVCREIGRKRRKMKEWSEDALQMHQDMESGESAVHDLLKEESIDEMMQVMKQLPDRQREAVVLRHLEGLPTDETATVMGCAEGTVKATLNHAMRRLRELMGAKA